MTDRAAARAEDARIRAARDAHAAQEEADRVDAFAALRDLNDADKIDRLERAVAELGRWARISAGPGVFHASPALVSLHILHPEPNLTDRAERERAVRDLARTHLS